MPSRTALGTALLLVFAFLAVHRATGHEWTRFRGPNGQGQSDAATIPSEWTKQDVNWDIELPGLGHSSPVIWGDKVFVASTNRKAAPVCCFVFAPPTATCFGTRNYPEARTACTHKTPMPQARPPATPSMCTSPGRCRTTTTWRLSTMQGNEVWRRNLGTYTGKHGFGTSPIIHEDMVIITNDQDGESWVAAVDRKSGETRWKIPREQETPQNASYSTPLIYTAGGREPELILHSWAHGISSHDPKTGRVNWEATVFDRRPVSSPVLVAGLIVGSCGDGAGTNSVVALRPGDGNGKKPEVAYKIPRAGAPYVPTLIAADDLLYLWKDDGVLTLSRRRDRKAALPRARRRQLLQLANPCRRPHLLPFGRLRDGRHCGFEGVSGAGAKQSCR